MGQEYQSKAVAQIAKKIESRRFEKQSDGSSSTPFSFVFMMFVILFIICSAFKKVMSMK